MKKTPILLKQHIGRMIQHHWFLKGRVKVIPTATEDILRSHGYEVVDIKEFLKPPRNKEEIKCIGFFDKEIPKNKNHPDYKYEPCFIYRNDNVLIEGIEQAKNMTNSVEICEGLPEILIENENKLSLPDEIHIETIKKIKLCCMLDAMQEELPKKKDPLRPAWIFPREFGITDVRKNDLLCKNLAVICEQFGQNVRAKAVILDAFFSTPIVAHNKNIQFEITSELVVTTEKKLKSLAEPSSTCGYALPEMGPVDCTISLNPHHFYVMQDIYRKYVNSFQFEKCRGSLNSISFPKYLNSINPELNSPGYIGMKYFCTAPGSASKWPYIQTAFIHFSPTQIRNITEEEITESQFCGRSLLNGFCIAVAEARAIFGSNIKELPEPVVVPVVQTDGKVFHFAIFQLNTLDLGKDSKVKNIFWNSQKVPLYTVCEYQAGRPMLEGYNPDVIRKLMSFYNLK